MFLGPEGQPQRSSEWADGDPVPLHTVAWHGCPWVRPPSPDLREEVICGPHARHGARVGALQVGSEFGGGWLGNWSLVNLACAQSTDKVPMAQVLSESRVSLVQLWRTSLLSQENFIWKKKKGDRNLWLWGENLFDWLSSFYEMVLVRSLLLYGNCGLSLIKFEHIQESHDRDSNLSLNGLSEGSCKW